MEITLRKALRLKNNLKGEIAKLREAILKYNTFTDKTNEKDKKDVNELLKQFNEKKTDFFALKTAISKANVGIYEKIAKVEELKDLISMLGNITIKNSTELVSIGFGKDPVETKYTSWISIETRDNLIVASQ